MMIISKGWYIFLGLAGLYAFSPPPPELDGFRFSISKPIIQPGERTELLITFRAPGSPETSKDLLPQIMEETLLQKKQWLVLDREFFRKDNVFQWRYGLTSHKLGTQTLPPVQVLWIGETYSTESFNVTVETSRPVDDTAIRDDYGHTSVPFAWGRFFLSFLFCCALACAFAFLKSRGFSLPARWFSYLNTLREPRPKEWLRTQLRILKNRTLSETGNHDLLHEFSRTVREFLKRELKAPAQTWTAEECLLRLPDKRQPMAHLLKSLNSVRFAPNSSSQWKTLLLESIESVEKTV